MKKKLELKKIKIKKAGLGTHPQEVTRQKLKLKEHYVTKKKKKTRT
jgi:hypothetical protein